MNDDYDVKSDFDSQVFAAMQDIADSFGGMLGLTKTGRVMVYGLDDAVSASSKISDQDLPWGYVVPATDHSLVFEF